MEEKIGRRYIPYLTQSMYQNIREPSISLIEKVLVSLTR